jgi:hypothetical protein
VTRRDFLDIEFVVIAELEPEYQCSVNYTIYEIVGMTGPHGWSEEGRALFQKAGCDSMEPIEDIARAETFAHGSVKWDGCSNWEFQKDCMIHACDREGLERIGNVLTRCWDLTAELCPKWSS